MAENPTYRYNIYIRLLHWVMAFMLFGMILSGYIMTKLDPKTAEFKWTLYGLHKSFGISFLFLSFIRIIIRLNSYIPPYKYEFSKIIRFMSSLVQKAFYGFFFAIPLTGFFSSAFAGYEISVFSYKLPKYFPVNKPLAKIMHQIHGYLPYIALIFIGLHIAGVIKHRYWDKKDILERII